jgi:hypothetical protein
MKVIARSATTRSSEHLDLPRRREGLQKTKQENIETETCPALVHMNTCYHNLLVSVVCTIQYYYVYFSNSIEYHLVQVLRTS